MWISHQERVVCEVPFAACVFSRTMAPSFFLLTCPIGIAILVLALDSLKVWYRKQSISEEKVPDL